MSIVDWFRRRLTPAPIPEALWASTVAGLPFLDALPDDDKARLRALTTDFLAQKRFSPAAGLTLTDEICVSIAAQGCLLILNLGLKAYADWVGVIVYPDEFVVSRAIADDSGVIHEFDDVLAGESWNGGPLVVSWRDVQLADAGYNVVIHEFAHKLDMLNGEADGIPALHGDLSEIEWLQVFDGAYEHFCERVDAAESRNETLPIDHYGAEAPEEFFAVISEAFFGQPAVVVDLYPALYDLLRRYYRQDPLARQAGAG